MGYLAADRYGVMRPATSWITNAGGDAVGQIGPRGETLPQRLNIRAFGVKGDGTTENMEKVYRAVAEAQPTGQPLYAPSGRYRFPEGILSNGPGLTLIGDPPVVKGVGGTDALKGTWFHFDHTGKGISIANAGGNPAGNFTDTRIQSIGTMRTQPAPAPGWAPTDHDWDIHADGVSDVILRDVTLWNATRGVVLAGGAASGPGRLELYGVRGQCFKNGIFVDTAYDVCRLDQIHIWPFWRDSTDVHTYTMANLDAIYMKRNDNPMLSNVFTIFARAGLRLGGNANGITSKVHLTNADFDRGYTGIWLDTDADGATGQFTNVTVQGETGVSGTKAVHIQSDNNVLAFANFRADVNHNNGIRIDGTGSKLTFSGELRIAGYDGAGIGFPAIEAAAGNEVRIDGYPNISGSGGGPRYGGAGTFYVNEWRDYTPTVTAGSGTFTAASAVGRYRLYDNTCEYIIGVTITTNGTAATDVRCTLPVAAVGLGAPGAGREIAATGAALLAWVAAGTQIVTIHNAADNTYPGASGRQLYVTGRYQI